jgi:hypothetical protein
MAIVAYAEILVRIAEDTAEIAELDVLAALLARRPPGGTAAAIAELVVAVWYATRGSGPPIRCALAGLRGRRPRVSYGCSTIDGVDRS